MDTPAFRGARSGRVQFATALLVIFCSGVALGQTNDDRFDRLWSHAELYTGNESATVRSIVFSGRLQVDQANVDSGNADFSDFDLRRFRLGVKIRFANDLTFHTEADYDPDGGKLGYSKMTDAYLSWSPGDALALTVGKHSAAFTMDGQTSSKELLTIDRSNLTNNIWFTDEYITGASAKGEKGGYVYHVGIFTSGPKDRGFGGSSGGEFVLTTVGRDFSDRLGANKALLRLNYVDNDPDPQNSFTRPLEKVLSLNFAYEQDRWGINSDISSARGYLGQSDISGLMIMPFINLRDKLQLVTRYTTIDSDDPNGLRFGRYEREIGGGRGDEYSEVYVGLNYYIYGHKLKIQTGLQYADMNDRAMDGGVYSGWGWTTGFRASW